ncbi:nucleotide reductase [Acinetobacter phage AC4]|nr:nucleotide reductase [Acinetobacter phage AC4]
MMNIEIYGIEEETFRCAGCESAKKTFNEAGLPYTFKRIVKLVDGIPKIDDELYAELKTKIAVSKLFMPYIFIDGTRVKIKELKNYLLQLGYDTF